MESTTANNFFSTAAGAHPRRELTLMLALGFAGLGLAWPQALFTGGGALLPAAN